MRIKHLSLALVFTICVGAPQVAFAYIGPGAGLSAIGTVIALVGAVLLAIVGFIWYPIKRLFRGKKKTIASTQTKAEPDQK